jgi:hypothetical protein
VGVRDFREDIVNFCSQKQNPHIMKIRLSLLALCLLASTLLCGQGFTPPAEGKAVVYFTRVTKLGFAISFEFFDGDKFIGDFKGQKYMRYECDAGQHLFWISSENKEFVTADLKAGGSYIVMVDVKMGAWKARVGVTPVTSTSGEKFDRAKELILKEAPIAYDASARDNKNTKLRGFIDEQLKKYEEVWKNEKNFSSVTADMAIPEEVMK